MGYSISIVDPIPGVGHFGSAPSTANKPVGGGLVPSVMYYGTVYGPVGLIDPGNIFEARAWASRFGWPVAVGATGARGAGVPVVYGVIADPHHVRHGGLDDSYLGIADDRRRHGGSPFSHSDGVVGSAGAWSWSSRSV